MIEAQKKLVEKGIHLSQQRIAIMDYLLKHKTHPTAEDIYRDLSPSMPSLSRTTVYNTLKLFSDHEAVLVLNIDDRNARFDGYTHHHAHFMCSNCEQLYDVPIPDHQVAIVRANPGLDGFRVRSVQIDYHGLCPRCCAEEVTLK